MAKSTSQSHATLIREFARGTSRSSRSSQHSGVSHSPPPTLSDFDPENEAMMSTQQLDNNAQHLPALRASAQKYNQFSRRTRPDPPIRSEPDYAINTSAIGRAFPDFSQGGTSSDDGSISIEIGRGAKKTNNGRLSNFGPSKEYSSDAQLDLGEDSLDFAAPMIGDYVITGTPPLRKHQPSRKVTETHRDSSQRHSQARGPSGLRRELLRTSSPVSKTNHYGSGESRKGNGDHGRTLASIHARVRDELDASQLDVDRPPTIDLTVRNTRFASNNHALPTKFSSTKGLLTKPGPDRQNTPQKATNHAGTQQSFLLPEMPNMSELISGVFENGTPVFPRHGKSRSSRSNKGSIHADVAEIPVPEDEQAIFLSLKLLQDKIAVLERNQAENEVVIFELDQRNQDLEWESAQQKKRVSHRSDSALGTSESEGEGRKLTIEKNRLENSVRSLQNDVDTSGRKLRTAETILRTITQERDSAVSQLSVAYVTIKQLEGENEDLKENNRVLRGPTQELSKGPESFMKKTANAHAEKGQTSAPQTTINSPSKSTRFAKRSHRHASAAKQQNGADFDVFDLTPKATTYIDNQGASGQQNEHGGDPEESEASIEEGPRGKVSKAAAKRKSSLKGGAQTEHSTRDLTYLNFLESNEVAKLRKTLEQEHIDRKQRLESKQQLSKVEETHNDQQPLFAAQESHRTMSRKSSMKDMTSRSAGTNNEDAAANEGHGLNHTRRQSEPSLLSTRSRRRDINVDKMTSAFIVPDITIRSNTSKGHGNAEMSKQMKNLEELAQHNGEKCTICKSNPNSNQPHTITIPKPVPVSDRVPMTGSYEEEPTIRPSQPPGLALATVIKSLEDEITHLKVQLAKYQALYSSHDPALSKRKRKSVQTKIESLLQTIDTKSDQIYALYDVLEGQKRDDQEMSEAEVEITLQSVGIDPARLNLRGGGVAEGDEPKGKTTERRVWDLSSEDEDDNLPWEGIESTVDTTKNSSSRARRRSTGV